MHSQFAGALTTAGAFGGASLSGVLELYDGKFLLYSFIESLSQTLISARDQCPGGPTHTSVPSMCEKKGTVPVTGSVMTKLQQHSDTSTRFGGIQASPHAVESRSVRTCAKGVFCRRSGWKSALISGPAQYHKSEISHKFSTINQLIVNNWVFILFLVMADSGFETCFAPSTGWCLSAKLISNRDFWHHFEKSTMLS